MNNETENQQEPVVKEVYSGAVELERIEIVQNVRKHFDPARMQELTESVQHNGVLVPVLLCLGSKEGLYRLIAGERRLRAAQSVGLKTIPARVVEAPHEKLEELQVLENLHRANLGPIEEARAFKNLLDAGSHSIEGLAQRVDKSVKYIARSVRLLELPQAAVSSIEAGNLSPEHGHQILRISEDKREKLVEWALTPKWGGVIPTIHELKQEISRRIERDLFRACFPKDKEYAGAMACAVCPFNTGNQNVLFEGAEAGKCTNGTCFTKKTNQFLREFKEQAEKRFQGLEFVGYGQDYGMQVKGTWVLRPEEAKSEKVKALIAAHPEKFGFAVLKSSAYGSKSAPTAVAVCKDQELLETVIRKAPTNGHRMLTPEEQARERFLDEAEVRALFAETAKRTPEATRGHLIDIVLALRGSKLAFEAMGMEVERAGGISQELEKLGEKDLLRLAWLCSIDTWNMDEWLEPLGVQVEQVRNNARSEALKEWNELQSQSSKKDEK